MISLNAPPPDTVSFSLASVFLLLLLTAYLYLNADKVWWRLGLAFFIELVGEPSALTVTQGYC